MAKISYCIFDTGADAIKIEPAENDVPRAVVKKIEGKMETLERHVPQMLLRGEQVAIIVKINWLCAIVLSLSTWHVPSITATIQCFSVIRYSFILYNDEILYAIYCTISIL